MSSSSAHKVTMAELNRQDGHVRSTRGKAVLLPLPVAIFLIMTTLTILLEVVEGGRKQAKSGRRIKKSRAGVGKDFSEFLMVIGAIMTCVIAPVFIFFLRSIYKAKNVRHTGEREARESVLVCKVVLVKRGPELSRTQWEDPASPELARACWQAVKRKLFSYLGAKQPVAPDSSTGRSSRKLASSSALSPASRRRRRNNSVMNANSNDSEDSNADDDASWAWRQGVTTTARALPPTRSITTTDQSYPAHLMGESSRGQHYQPSRGVHFQKQERDYDDYASYGRRKHGPKEEVQQRHRQTTTTMAPHSSGALVPPLWEAARPRGVDGRGITAAAGTEFGVESRPGLPMRRRDLNGGSSSHVVATSTQEASAGFSGGMVAHSSSFGSYGGMVEWDPYPDDDYNDDDDDDDDLNDNTYGRYRRDELGELVGHGRHGSKAASRGVYENAQRRRRTTNQ